MSVQNIKILFLVIRNQNFLSRTSPNRLALLQVYFIIIHTLQQLHINLVNPQFCVISLQFYEGN